MSNELVGQTGKPVNRLLAETVYHLVAARGQGESPEPPRGTAGAPSVGSTQRQVDRAFQQITGLTKSATPEQVLKALQQRFRKKEEQGYTSLEYIPGPHVTTIDLEPHDPTRKEWFQAFDGVHMYAKEALANAQSLIDSLTPITLTDQETFKARRHVLSIDLAAFLNDPGPEPHVFQLVQQIVLKDLPLFGASLGLVKVDENAPAPLSSSKLLHENVVTPDENATKTRFLALHSLVQAAVQTWTDFVGMLSNDLGYNLRLLSDALATVDETIGEIWMLMSVTRVGEIERRIPILDIDIVTPSGVPPLPGTPYKFAASLEDLLMPLQNFASQQARVLLQGGGRVAAEPIRFRCKKTRVHIQDLVSGRGKKHLFTGILGELELKDRLIELENDLHRAETLAVLIIATPSVTPIVVEPALERDEESPATPIEVKLSEDFLSENFKKRITTLGTNASKFSEDLQNWLANNIPLPVRVIGGGGQKNAPPSQKTASSKKVAP